MASPWSWKEHLEYWVKILHEHVNNLNIDAGSFDRHFCRVSEARRATVSIEMIPTAFSEDRKEAESRLKNAWQNYCETGDELDANSPMNKRAARLSSVEDETMLPLPDDVLTRNLGLDIVVVVTKVTLMPNICSCRPFFETRPILITISKCILSNRRTTWQHWRRSTTTEMSISILCSSGFGAFVCSTAPRCSTPALRRTKTVIYCTSI